MKSKKTLILILLIITVCVKICTGTNVSAKEANTYTVSFPAQIDLICNENEVNGNYDIMVSGNIEPGKYVTVKPVNTLILSDKPGNRFIYPTVTQDETIWEADELNESLIVTKSGNITADIKLAGQYSGDLVFEFSLDGEAIDAEGVLYDSSSNEIITFTAKDLQKDYSEYYNFPQSIGIDPNSIGSIRLPEDATAIGNYAFSNCSALTSINLPENISVIGEGAFTGCSAINSIDLSNVDRIEDKAFCNCYSLNSIYINNEATYVGEYTFKNCSALRNVNIPDSLSEISEGLFYNCMSLSDIYIPDSVWKIGSYAFYNCSALQSINIPAETIEIESESFTNCYSLNRATFTKTNEWYKSGEKIPESQLMDTYSASNVLRNIYSDHLSKIGS